MSSSRVLIASLTIGGRGLTTRVGGSTVAGGLMNPVFSSVSGPIEGRSMCIILLSGLNNESVLLSGPASIASELRDASCRTSLSASGSE